MTKPYAERCFPSEYTAWRNMIKRCTNKYDPSYINYGERGITIDPKWKNFRSFLNDIGLKLSQQHTLERIDNNKGYYKENCKWATRTDQQRNRRSNKLTQEKVDEIRLLYKTGKYSTRYLGKQFDVSSMMISDIIRYKWWK